MEKMKRGLIIVIVAVASCNGPNFATSPSQGGGIAIQVTQTKGEALSSPRFIPQQFLVEITGPEMVPMQAVFDAAATEGAIEGVPEGPDRTVHVTAVNAEAEMIRAGEAHGVTVYGAEVTAVTIPLERLPLFATLHEGSVVYNTRFRADLIGEPGHPLSIQAGIVFDDTALPALAPLLDVSTGRSEILADWHSGHVVIAPKRFAPGAYHLIARDEQTGRHSAITVRLIDGTQRRGAALVSAGEATTRMGTPYGVTAPHTQTVWPTMVRLIAP